MAVGDPLGGMGLGGRNNLVNLLIGNPQGPTPLKFEQNQPRATQAQPQSQSDSDLVRQLLALIMRMQIPGQAPAATQPIIGAPSTNVPARAAAPRAATTSPRPLSFNTTMPQFPQTPLYNPQPVNQLPTSAFGPNWIYTPGLY